MQCSFSYLLSCEELCAFRTWKAGRIELSAYTDLTLVFDCGLGPVVDPSPPFKTSFLKAVFH